jgi:hypothetical protein
MHRPIGDELALRERQSYPKPVFALLLCLSMTAAPPPVSTDGTLAVVATAFRFRSDTERVVLGETTVVTIDIHAEHQGALLDDKLPELSTSVGTLSAVERTRAGDYRVRFTPPSSGFPQVAMISATTATASTSFIGLLPLQLWGTGIAAVKTKSNSTVEVIVNGKDGARSFGPVRTGKNGLAEVPLLLPPGIAVAIARSRDDAGNVSERPVDLGIPSFNRLALLSLDRVVAADGTGSVRVAVFTVDGFGVPNMPPNLRWAANGVAMTVAPRPIAAGVSIAKVPVLATRLSSWLVTAEADVGTAHTEVALISGPAAEARLSAPVVQVGMDDLKQIPIQVIVVDAAGNIVPLAAVNMEVDRGRIGAINPNADGSATLMWLLPDEWQAPATATLQLRQAGNTQTVASLSIALVAGRLSSLDMDAPAPMVADGQAASKWVVRGHDRLGNAVPVTTTTLKITAAGVTSTVEQVDDGSIVVTLVPIAIDDERQVNITIDHLGVSKSVSWRLLARSKDLLVAPFVGASTAFGAATAATVELDTLARLPILDGSTFVGMSLSYHHGVPLAETAFADHRSVGTAVRFAWRPSLTSWVGMHLGAGIGVMLTERAQNDDGAGLATAAIAGLAVGPWLPVGPGTVELQGRLDGLISTETSVPTPLGVGVVLGYRFAL